LKPIGRIASIGTVAALVLSAAVATWVKSEEAHGPLDLILPWTTYFAAFLIYAFIALGVIMLVYVCARFVLARRAPRPPHA
jgi:hypothetical protein